MSCPSSFILYKTSRFPLKKTQICKRLLILELVQSSSRRICDLQRKALYFDNRVSDYRNRAKSGKSFSSIGCRHQFQGCCNCAVEETLMVHCQVIEDFNMVLEDQNGKKVQMGLETDLRAIMISLMLHTNAKQLIKAQNYQDALEVPSMGEEAFSLCDQKVIELVDNPSILQIDMVWCYFMLRDINWLSVAGIRLEKAREGLERAHGRTLLSC